MSGGILWQWNETSFLERVLVGGGEWIVHTCFHPAFCTAAPISVISTTVLFFSTVLGLEEIKHSLTHFCLQLSLCMAGLLTPACWEEQRWEQLWLLGSCHMIPLHGMLQ